MVDQPDHRISQLANSIRDIPQLMPSPRSSRASMIYTTSDLRLLLERVVREVGVVSERDMARILEALLTSWLPTFLQDPERDYPSDEPTPEAIAEDAEMRAAIRDFADGLSDVERWILLSKSQSIADAKIAVRLGRSRPWVAEQKRNVLERLGTELMSLFHDDRRLPAVATLLDLISDWPCAETWVGWGEITHNGWCPMGGVRFFGGHCAWVARWTGGGSDPGEIWRVVRLSKDLSACPRSGGRVLARSGHDLVGALACQHRECIVCRFWPEPHLERR